MAHLRISTFEFTLPIVIKLVDKERGWKRTEQVSIIQAKNWCQERRKNESGENIAILIHIHLKSELGYKSK